MKPRSAKTDFAARVSTYDRVSSLLLALVILCGLAASTMFVMWLVRNISFEKRLPVIAAPFEPVGIAEPAEGIAQEFDEPGSDELADVPNPQLSDVVKALTEVAANVVGDFANVGGAAELMGTGPDVGDRRKRGAIGPDRDSIPAGARWQVHFVTTSLKEYAQQLDYFNIEIGTVHRSNPKIEFARNLSKEKPDRRAGDRAGEKKRGRLWLTWPKNSKLRKYDVALLERAGIATKNHLIIEFYPAELQTKLLKLELDSVKRQMPKRTIEDVRHTHFEVRKTGATYKLTVKKHDFR